MSNGDPLLIRDAQLSEKPVVRPESPLRWVVAAWVEWVATADSPGTFQRTFDGSVFLNCLDEVAAARRLEAALLTDQRAEEDLVEPYHADEDLARQVDDQFPEI